MMRATGAMRPGSEWAPNLLDSAQITPRARGSPSPARSSGSRSCPRRRAARHAVRGRGHRRTEPRERRQRDLETAAFRAETMTIRHLDVVEAHVADRVRAEHFEARDLEATRRARHVEHRQALRISDLAA